MPDDELTDEQAEAWARYWARAGERREELFRSLAGLTPFKAHAEHEIGKLLTRTRRFVDRRLSAVQWQFMQLRLARASGASAKAAQLSDDIGDTLADANAGAKLYAGLERFAVGHDIHWTGDPCVREGETR